MSELALDPWLYAGSGRVARYNAAGQRGFVYVQRYVRRHVRLRYNDMGTSQARAARQAESNSLSAMGSTLTATAMAKKVSVKFTDIVAQQPSERRSGPSNRWPHCVRERMFASLLR